MDNRGHPEPMDGTGPNQGMGMGMMGGAGQGAGSWERAFPCVRLRGLPYDVLEDEIRTFLTGCDPVDILMAKRDGRFCGEAYVVLGTPVQVEVAMSKNKTYLGRRYVEVFRAKKLDYYKAVVAEMSDGNPGMSRGGRGHGYGMDPYQGQHMYQYPDEYGQAPMGGMGGGHAPHGGMGGGSSGGGTNLVKLRGLPFSVTEGEIRMWFEDPSLNPQPISPTNIYIVSDHGRATGVAYVEFASPNEVNIARAKDKAMLGSRYIEIFPASRSDLDRYGFGRGGYSSGGY